MLTKSDVVTPTFLAQAIYAVSEDIKSHNLVPKAFLSMPSFIHYNNHFESDTGSYQTGTEKYLYTTQQGMFVCIHNNNMVSFLLCIRRR